jgi:cephalosporin hydroxylase
MINMINIKYKLYDHVSADGDISEHLLYLERLSRDCNSILECGVRSVVSSWAFLNGLVKNATNGAKILHSCDLDRSSNINELEIACVENSVSFKFHKCSDLVLPYQKYDMIFIDTWHVYGHLKRELSKLHEMAAKYIVMHDTEIDGIHGETIRNGWNPYHQSIDTGIPVDEIMKGLQPAIDEFLAEHKEWKIKAHFSHNNGLTVLERI